MAPSSTKLSTRARIGIGVGAGLIAILAAAYVGGHFLAGDRLPTKASVAGIPVGGLSPADAEQKLRTGLAERSGQQLAITGRLPDAHASPRTRPASVSTTPPRSHRPAAAAPGTRRTILTVLFGGSPHPAVVAVDQQKLDAAVASLAAKVDVAPVDAEVAYAGLKPVRTVSKDGVALDRAATAAEVTAAFLNQVEVTAVVGVAEPVVTTAEADQVVTGIAATAVAGPVDIAVDDRGTIRLPASAIAASLGFEPRDGALSPVFDSAKLDAEAAAPLKALGLKQPRDATITIEQGQAEDRPVGGRARRGSRGTRRGTGAGLVAGARPDGDRHGEPACSGVHHRRREEARGEGGDREVHHLLPRHHLPLNNIGKAARLINGTFLKPGETFSMNKTLGKRTTAAGWMAGGAIDGGRIVRAAGRRHLPGNDNHLQRHLLRRVGGHLPQAALAVLQPLPRRQGGNPRLGERRHEVPQ